MPKFYAAMPVLRCFALVIALSSTAHAQIYCAPSTPCVNGSGPYNTATGDKAADAFGKINSVLFTTETPNTVLAAPSGVTGLPSWRTLVQPDLPGSPVVYQTTNAFAATFTNNASVFPVQYSGAWTLTLPQIGANNVNAGGYQLFVPSFGGGSGTITPYSGQKINGSTSSLTTPSGANSILFADNTGSGWFDATFPGSATNVFSGAQFESFAGAYHAWTDTSNLSGTNVSSWVAGPLDNSQVAAGGFGICTLGDNLTTVGQCGIIINRGASGGLGYYIHDMTFGSSVTQATTYSFPGGLITAASGLTATTGNLTATAGNIVATAGSIKAGVISPQTGGTCATGQACITSPGVGQLGFYNQTTAIGNTDSSGNFNWTGGNITSTGSIKAPVVAAQSGGSCAAGLACLTAPTAGQPALYAGTQQVLGTNASGDATFYGAIKPAGPAPTVACAVAPGNCTGVAIGTGATTNVGTLTLTASATGVSNVTLTFSQTAANYWICIFSDMTHTAAGVTQLGAYLTTTKATFATGGTAQSGDVINYLCFPQ